MGLISNLLLGYRVVVDSLGVAWPTRNRLKFMGPMTVTDDEAGDQTIATFGGSGTSPTFGATSVTSLAVGSNYSSSSPPNVTTTDGSTIVLATVPITKIGTTIVRAFVTGTIQSARNAQSYVQLVTYTIQYTATAHIGNPTETGGSPAYDAAVAQNPDPFLSASAGLSEAFDVGPVFKVRVVGIPMPSAWVGATSYTVGQLVTHDSGKVYMAVRAGTSAASGGPTGTGTGIADGIGLGAVLWDYVDTSPRVVWELGLLEVM